MRYSRRSLLTVANAQSANSFASSRFTLGESAASSFVNFSTFVRSPLSTWNEKACCCCSPRAGLVHAHKITRTIPKHDSDWICNFIARAGSSLRLQCWCKAYSINSHSLFVERFESVCIVNEEADETVFWLEVISELGNKSDQLEKLKKESEEILKIVAKSISTSRANYQNSWVGSELKDNPKNPEF